MSYALSMLQIWRVRISPLIGKPGGRTTLVGNGHTRDVIGQTTAKPVYLVNAADETTNAGRFALCLWSGRSRSRSDRRRRVRKAVRSFFDDHLTADVRSPVEGPGIRRPPLFQAFAFE